VSLGDAITKPGKHGTLFRYVVEYRDAHDDCCPIFTWHAWAYNLEHAELEFSESGEEGWRIVSIRRLLDGICQHRAVRHTPMGV
jgi:hypothetical protein